MLTSPVDPGDHERIRMADNSSACIFTASPRKRSTTPSNTPMPATSRSSLGLSGKRGYLSIQRQRPRIRQPFAQSRGLGLRIMQHRCSLIDAEFRIQNPALEHGTEVKCYFTVEN